MISMNPSFMMDRSYSIAMNNKLNQYFTTKERKKKTGLDSSILREKS